MAANRHDVRLLEPTLDAVVDAGLLADIDTLHLDRGYDSGAVRRRLAAYDLTDVEIQLRGKVPGVKKQPVRIGLRWIVEAINAWWSNYGQLRRNTDRKSRHRHARPLPRHHHPHRRSVIDWRNRWSPARRLSAQVLSLADGRGVRRPAEPPRSTVRRAR